ncbi:hydrogenase expression/formation protein HypE [Nonomuraea guangzhouensis]|uniref:Hydrogenase expression/formation protein HypE n=1 Tax=Nonomuraea guangzhouensis TaxID=1291555 RepID=A0ABW4GZ07_9ACTN|nr:hydrogenase expression/formation protein HypE [Nonomuraea guangzhouensis]
MTHGAWVKSAAEPDTDQRIVLDHGTGARLSRELVDLIVEVLGDAYAGELEDSAELAVEGARLAVTTDSFVVDPPFFGNGDIGKIAVCGTVNDLAVIGAAPRYLTLAMIIESGLPFGKLIRVLESVRETAREAGVRVVAGDTKVVRTGEADQIYLNTTGVGFLHRPSMRMTDVRPGDRVLLSGHIADHTVHLLSIREGLGFEERVPSDCAPLNGLVEAVLDAVPAGDVRSIRDVTRGGLSAVLHEYALRLAARIRIEETALPVRFETRMATEMLGIDPVNCANEGCLCLFVAPRSADAVLEILRSHKYGTAAAQIGEVAEPRGARVEIVRPDGRVAELEDLQGAELPRLC